jgi:GLPGLI family protein
MTLLFKIFSTLSLVLFSTVIFGQMKEGIIKYKQTIYFEFENMPPDMPKSMESFHRLVLKNDESVYEKDPDVKPISSENDNTPRMFRRMRSSKTTYKNLSLSKVIEQQNMFGKDFLVMDSIENFKWKISAGEQKVVAGYTCMKAFFKDSTNNFVVFFTTQIPKKNGPDKFGGLPGVILEVQSAQTHIIATEVINSPVPELLIPSKGDKMSRKEFTDMVKQKTEEMRQMWGDRMGRRSSGQ